MWWKFKLPYKNFSRSNESYLLLMCFRQHWLHKILLHSEKTFNALITVIYESILPPSRTVYITSPEIGWEVVVCFVFVWVCYRSILSVSSGVVICAMINPVTLRYEKRYIESRRTHNLTKKAEYIKVVCLLVESIVHAQRSGVRKSIRFNNLALQWRYNGRHGVSNYQPHHCLLNRLFRRRSEKTSKLHVTGLCAGNSPVNSPHKWPVTRKMFPFDDVIMEYTFWQWITSVVRQCPDVKFTCRRVLCYLSTHLAGWTIIN